MYGAFMSPQDVTAFERRLELAFPTEALAVRIGADIGYSARFRPVYLAKRTFLSVAPDG